jgi:hypothetical protein
MNELDLARRRVRLTRCFHTTKFYSQTESFGSVSKDLMKLSFEDMSPVSRFEDNRRCGFNRMLLPELTGNASISSTTQSYCYASRSQENNEQYATNLYCP